jgi:protein involved in polysaccharide export with SLBB domain
MKRKSVWLFAVTAFLLLSEVAICAQQKAADSRGTISDTKPFITVVGAVRLQARYQARRPVRLIELLALSGGMTERAGKAIRIYRHLSLSDAARLLRDDELKKTAGFEAYSIADLLRSGDGGSPPVQPGDIVYVEEPGVVYITGDVKIPQMINLIEALTLRQAIEIAGGLSQGAEKDKIFIYRQGSGKWREIITVKHKDIASLKTDIVLYPADIICVRGKRSIGRSCPSTLASPLPLTGELPLRTIW